MSRNYVNALDRLTEAYETIDAHDKKPGAAWLVQASQAHMLAAINDEQRLHTGLLTDLRGAIDDLAEVLRPKGDPCPCGCRRDVEATEDEPCGYACNSIYAGCPVHDPEATPTPEPEQLPGDDGPLIGERDPNDVDIAICEGCGRHLPCRHCEDGATEGGRWPVDGMTVAEASEAARKVSEVVREAHSGDSGVRPEPDTVTLPRGVVDVAWARLDIAASDPAANQEYATRHRAAADALLAALAAATNPYARQEADDARD